MPSEVAEALRAFADDGNIGSTHYAGCWRYHWRCAMNVAADVIDDLDAELLKARAEIVHLWELVPDEAAP